jgi:phenylalanyl-tRNA synthetase beta chain
MLPTGLEVIAHNINRKNADLLLFENGKTYLTSGPGSYEEQKHLSLFTTGNARLASWNQQPVKADYFFLKSICEKVLLASGIVGAHFEDNSDGQEQSAEIKWKKNKIGQLGLVPEKVLKQFGIKQPVFYADLFWDQLVELRNKKSFAYREISKFPPVQRDLALVLDKKVTYAQLKETVGALKVQQLQAVKLFDIFESEKLGPGKKSMAVNFTFLDSSKTLTDKEIDDIMNNLISAFEKDLQAEVRK